MPGRRLDCAPKELRGLHDFTAREHQRAEEIQGIRLARVGAENSPIAFFGLVELSRPMELERARKLLARPSAVGGRAGRRGRFHPTSANA
jgi:hypothetical protein